jgi:hypothetical protein
MRTTRSSFVFATLVLLGTACSSASVKVLAEASPNPFSKTATFHLAPVEFVGVKVDERSEDDYIAHSKEHERERKSEQWTQIKANVQDRFATTLAAALREEGLAVADDAAPGAFTVRPTIDQVETGYYRIPAWNAVARIYMKLEILGPDRRVLDELRLSDRCPFDVMSYPTVNIRLLTITESLAEVAAEHIVERSTSG